jgi:Mg2+/Co2+ transporter CorB
VCVCGGGGWFGHHHLTLDAAGVHTKTLYIACISMFINHTLDTSHLAALPPRLAAPSSPSLLLLLLLLLPLLLLLLLPLLLLLLTAREDHPWPCHGSCTHQLRNRRGSRHAD